ncbi:MAG TPA: SOS response-associated peptidase [Candidatus Angelobacter sp.]|jgi:putative SOS response-associated peptidase YedK|nr:SOS response-associated peptidase [Candidatus Angelobacter sp.]
MCGRYRLTSRENEIAEYFDITSDVEWSPRFNIAPSQQVAVIRQRRSDEQGTREFCVMRWGLIPYWAKDPFGFKTINAMSETAAAKPAFREPMKWRRCLMPANSFYEWQKTGRKEKQPYNIGMADDSLFAMAGLWDRWQDPESKSIETCTILTTQTNALLSDIHDRMPVIIDKDNYDLWLDRGITDPERVSHLLHPFDPRLMKKYPVSTYVNSVNNDDEACLQEWRTSLFS